MSRSLITTHVLDTSRGCPASGIRVVLHKLRNDEQREFIADGHTDDDGRIMNLLEPSTSLEPGVYVLTFWVHDYFVAQKKSCFFPKVDIFFHFQDLESHYHVPLLLSPYSYTTYRGS